MVSEFFIIKYIQFILSFFIGKLEHVEILGTVGKELDGMSSFFLFLFDRCQILKL